MIRAGLLVHGGAGALAAEREAGARDGCVRAAAAGYAILERGGPALDAVEAAVRALEQDPAFNAGRGAVLNRLGEVELDAAIMDGRELRLGAVAAVPPIESAVALARRVLEEGEHVLLAGPAALELAREVGVAVLSPDALTTERQRQRWREEIARALEGLAPAAAEGGGTVGAVAVDRAGHVAAATSTGGLALKRRGRVGDSPLPGCGTYADDALGAASATGPGEAIARFLLARDALGRLAACGGPGEAAAAALAALEQRLSARAGLILAAPDGRLGHARTTAAMPVAWSRDGGEAGSGL